MELEFVTLFKMMNKEENNKRVGVECGGALQSHSTPTLQSHQSSSPVENQSASQRTILRSYHQCLCFGELMMSHIRGSSNIMRCSHFLNCPSYWMDGNCAWNEVLHTIHEIMGWSSKEMLINQLLDQQNLLFGCPALTSWWARLLRLGSYSVVVGEILFKNVQLCLPIHYCSKVVGLLNHFCINSIITNFIK